MRRAKIEETRASWAATAATIVEVEEGGRVTVRLPAGSGARAGTLPVAARLARLPGYRASVGDRVLVSGEGDEVYVIGVLCAAAPAALELGDGSLATVEGGALEVRDPAGRLLVRYADGAAEIAAPSGDLVMSAPAGRVVLRSGLDVAVEAARDVVHRAGRNVELAAGRADAQVKIEPRTTHVRSERFVAETNHGRLIAGELETLARAVSTTAEALTLSADKYELTATRLVEKTRDAFRDVLDLAQSRIGRARTVIAGVYTLHARRTVMASKEETSIDGRKVLLG